MELKDRGSLKRPSDELIAAVNRFHSVFDGLHGEDVDRREDPLERTTQEIMKKETMFPQQVVFLYVKIRFFNRIQILNRKLKERQQSNSVRSLKQKAQFIF